jgi:hypothetical protein
LCLRAKGCLRCLQVPRGRLRSLVVCRWCLVCLLVPVVLACLGGACWCLVCLLVPVVLACLRGACWCPLVPVVLACLGVACWCLVCRLLCLRA